MHAQDTTTIQNKKPFVSGIWIQGGFGLGTFPGPCQEAGLNFKFLEHNLFTVEFNGVYSFQTSNPEYFQDIAVMVGYSMQVKRFSFSFSGGISSYNGAENFRHDTIIKMYVGDGYMGSALALRSQVMYKFSKHFATSLDLYGSLSSGRSQGMLTLNFIYSPFKWDGR